MLEAIPTPYKGDKRQNQGPRPRNNNFPGNFQESLPDTSTCAKIGEVFSQLNAAHKAYSEAAEGLAELSTLVMPDQFTLLLTATAIPAIQLIVPGHLM